MRLAAGLIGLLALPLALPLLQPLDSWAFLAINSLGDGPEWLYYALDPHWERGGPGHPILQDLLHLQIAAAQARTRSHYGRALVAVVLPRLRANGGDALIERYCRQLQIRFEPSLLMPLVTARWLFDVAHELARFRDRAENETWLGENVESVAAALAAA